MLDYGLWAAGALTIGLGIVPTIAGLASIVRPRGEEREPGVQALAVVTLAAVGVFGFYTAVKAAYLSTVFATLTLERNLIYLAPILFAGTALFFQRRGGRSWAIVAAGGFVLYLVRGTPYGLTSTRTTRPTGWRSPPSPTASSAGRPRRSSTRSQL